MENDETIDPRGKTVLSSEKKTEPLEQTKPDGSGLPESFGNATTLALPSSGDDTLPVDTGNVRVPVGEQRSVFARPEGDRYEREGELARGGMGRIVVATDRVLGRVVALKELLEIDLEPLLRFEREARITARLQHPSIVPLYEAGQGTDGLPFFAMKKVNGRSLDQVIAEKRSLTERLQLLPTVLAVAEAMAYAHSEGVIHRDLKPLNVLVGAFGETVVIDWGIARDLRDHTPEQLALNPTRNSDGQLTVAGAVMGTPAYMAPEQAEGATLDERADVYALGALLYHTLSGRPPYEGESAWVVLARVQVSSPTPLSQVEPSVPPELAAIVAHAMERDREKRYQNAGLFAEDLRRFLHGQLVGAHEYSFRELALRWVRKHRGEVLTGAVGIVALVLVGSVSVARIVRAEQHARSDAEAARRAAAVALQARRASQASANRALLARAHEALQRDPARTLALLRELSLDGDGWEAARVLAADASSRTLPETVWNVGGAAVGPVVWSRDGTRCAVQLDHQRIAIVERASERVETLSYPVAWTSVLYRFRSDGALVLQERRNVMVRDVRGAVRTYVLASDPAVMDAIGDAFSEYSLQRTRPQTPAFAVQAVSDDGRWALRSPLEGTLEQRMMVERVASAQVWDASASGQRFPTRVTGLSPRGQWAFDLQNRLFDASTGAEVLLPLDPPRWIRFSANDDRFVVGNHQSSMRFVLVERDAATGTIAQREAEGAIRSSVVLSPDGNLLAAPGEAGVQLSAWRMRGDAPSRVLQGHEHPLSAQAGFSPDGRWLLTAGREGTARLWQTTLGDGISEQSIAGYVTARALANGVWIALLATADGISVRRWDGSFGVSVALQSPPGAAELLHGMQQTAIDPSGRWAVLVHLQRSEGASVWDLATGRRVASVPNARQAVFLGEDRAVLATQEGLSLLALSDGSLTSLPMVTRESLAADAGWLERCVSPRVGSVWAGASSRLLVALHCGATAGRSEQGLAVFSLTDRQWRALPWDTSLVQVERQQQTLLDPLTRQFRGSAQALVYAVRVSADGRWAGVVRTDDVVELWDLALLRRYEQAVGPGISMLGFTSSQHLVFVNSGEWFSWWLREGLHRAPRPRHSVDVWAMSAQGDRMVLVGDGQATLLDVSSGEHRSLLGSYSIGWQGLSTWFSQDGTRVHVLSNKNPNPMLATFEDNLPREPRALRTWLQRQRFVLDPQRLITDPGVVHTQHSLP